MLFCTVPYHQKKKSTATKSESGIKIVKNRAGKPNKAVASAPPEDSLGC